MLTGLFLFVPTLKYFLTINNHNTHSMKHPFLFHGSLIISIFRAHSRVLQLFSSLTVDSMLVQ